MSLKTISITPNQGFLSDTTKALFAKFVEANKADDSHYYQTNAKATKICNAIGSLESLKSAVRSYATRDDATRAAIYENVKANARELLAACDEDDTVSHEELPKKYDVLNGIGEQIAEQLHKDLTGKYLCVKPNLNHTVTIIEVYSIRSTLELVDYTEYDLGLKIYGAGVRRTDEVNQWSNEANSLSFGTFNVNLELCNFVAPSKGFAMGVVTAKQFAEYIAKATKEMSDAVGLKKELSNATGQEI